MAKAVAPPEKKNVLLDNLIAHGFMLKADGTVCSRTPIHEAREQAIARVAAREKR